MSKYINLEDPEVRYTYNYGPAEVYIVPPEAERIDLVRCGECKWFKYCEHNESSEPYGFCSWGERREDG